MLEFNTCSMASKPSHTITIVLLEKCWLGSAHFRVYILDTLSACVALRSLYPYSNYCSFFYKSYLHQCSVQWFYICISVYCICRIKWYYRNIFWWLRLRYCWLLAWLCQLWDTWPEGGREGNNRSGQNRGKERRQREREREKDSPGVSVRSQEQHTNMAGNSSRLFLTNFNSNKEMFWVIFQYEDWRS